MEAEKKVASGEDSYGNESEQASSTEFLDFPGGKVSYTNELQFLSESSPVRVPCFQLLDEYGQVVEHACLPEVRYDVSLFFVGGIFGKMLEKTR
jgi:hypothetical protein